MKIMPLSIGKLILLLATIIGLTRGMPAKEPAQYDMAGIVFISYTDIDTVCEDEELIRAGQELLSGQRDNLLLSFVVDSAIELSAELGDYDHLVLTNPLWVERFGDPEKLKPVEYGDLPEAMRTFLANQMSMWTKDASAFPEGTGLYEYEGGGLLSFPVSAALGWAKEIEAENPLVVLIADPAETLNPRSCALPLTSSGNILFSDGEQLRLGLENSSLKEYCKEIRTLGGE